MFWLIARKISLWARRERPSPPVGEGRALGGDQSDIVAFEEPGRKPGFPLFEIRALVECAGMGEVAKGRLHVGVDLKRGFRDLQMRRCVIEVEAEEKTKPVVESIGR